jgi:hypothetical protein
MHADDFMGNGLTPLCRRSIFVKAQAHVALAFAGRESRPKDRK